MSRSWIGEKGVPDPSELGGRPLLVRWNSVCIFVDGEQKSRDRSTTVPGRLWFSRM